MKLTLLQTSDDQRYLPMLRASEPLSRAFCQRHGFDYQPYVGMVRGRAPVHAVYNRVFLLQQMVLQGYDGWVLYMDADAWIQDLDFDLKAYLAEQGPDADFIAAEASPEVQQKWAINNGVFLINLGSLVGRRIVVIWHHLVQTMVPPEHWANPEADWAPPEYDDQNLLYRALVCDPTVLPRVKKEASDLINYNGRFIGQCLRADYPSFEERLAHVRAEVAKRLPSAAQAAMPLACAA